ncbi:MAG TPA: hypothetical protein VLD67_00295 [Vicinamibacterales bacterium]|nr:hypothetical protein [Vicinamibacterales bacterium]
MSQEPMAAGWQVSPAGGTSPRWTPDGRELLYYADNGLVSARIRPGDAFGVTERVALFDYAPFTGRLGPDYDVAANGSRFLMIRSSRETPSTRVQLALVQNWIRELGEKVQ